MTDLSQLIAEEVLIVLRERHSKAFPTILPDTSLVEDLGLDSIGFVDLTLRLETRLKIQELPLHDWIDAEGMRSGRKYTLSSLSKYTETVLADRGITAEIR
jgi:acyl carrier protein